MDIYVGNLAREVTEEELRKEFMVFGKVTSVKIIKDRNSGQPRVFAFVSMPSKLEAQGAIITLNRKKLRKQIIRQESKNVN